MTSTDIDPLPSLVELLRQPAWMRDAACKEHPELPWVPDRGQDCALIPAMRAVCAACLVREECLQFACSWDAPAQGVWGETVATERAAIRRAKRAA